MNEIQDAGVNQQLVRRLGITDTAAPAGSLAPEVFPVMQVAPPSIEQELLRGEFPSACGLLQGAFAANYSHIQLANLPGSNILVMVDSVSVYAAGALIVAGVVQDTTLLSTQNPTGVRDTRVRPTTTTRQTAAVVSSEVNITAPFAAAGKRLFYWFGASHSVEHPVNVVLQPGMSFRISTNDVNVTLFATIHWRERRAQPSELG